MRENVRHSKGRLVSFAVIGCAALGVVSPAVAQNGSSVTATTLVRRALQANQEINAARLDLERGRARLRQAGLRPNPTFDLQHTTGRLTGSTDERDLTAGVALPIELGGQRQRRIELAEAEVAAIEAEIADRERQLTRDVLGAWADALAAARELEITENVRDLDEQTMRIVRTRVETEEAPRLELSLLLTEVDRLRSRRVLAQGRLDAALITLKNLIGAPPSEALTVEAPLAAFNVDPSPPPATLDAAIEMALQRRPDVQLARLNEVVAQAGLRLARAQAFPDATVSGAYSRSRGVSELPGGLMPIPDTDHVLTFGVSIGLPFFNRNQGAQAEAAVAIRQAEMRRAFAEQTARAEVTSAFGRLEAARTAVAIFEPGVIDRSTDNIRVIRAAYELGEFRIIDVINEQRRLLDSQREYTEAVAERYRATADVLAAVGATLESQP